MFPLENPGRSGFFLQKSRGCSSHLAWLSLLPICGCKALVFLPKTATLESTQLPCRDSESIAMVSSVSFAKHWLPMPQNIRKIAVYQKSLRSTCQILWFLLPAHQILTSHAHVHTSAQHQYEAGSSEAWWQRPHESLGIWSQFPGDFL